MRFGLLGTGHWASETQGAALASHPEAELVGVWGRDPAKADSLAKRHDCRAYEDVDALIADVDAVSIALPPDVQGELAARAAEAGRHLLLDKPLALTMEAANRIVAAVERHDLASVVFFTSRFDPVIDDFLRATAAQGGWIGARATRFSSISEPDSPYGGSAWRKEKGGLWDVGPHVLSVVLPVLGQVAEVTALSGAHGTKHVMLRHNFGGVSSLAVTLDAPPVLRGGETIFYGEHGTVTVPDAVGTSMEAFGSAISQLLQAARHRAPHPCGVHLGRLVVAILIAAETAEREGRTVSL